MRAAQLWSPETKFIEFGAASKPVGELLVHEGFDKYLAVVAGESQGAELGKEHPILADRLVVSRTGKAVRHNNADVLVLNRGAVWSTVRFRNLRHAHWVTWRAHFEVRLMVAWAACLFHLLCGRLGRPRFVRFEDRDGRTATLVAFPIRKHRPPKGARHWVPHRLGVAGLLRQLVDRDVRHAVLRWFESLPELPPDEDLDLLVADDDLERVFEILADGPGIQPCDVYSETGLPRSDFRGMPYFPPYLAHGLLARAQLHHNTCRVPAPRDHFLSLVYHAFYHKGPASGLPDHARASRPAKHVDHDYAEVLRQLAEGLQIEVEISRAGLETFAAEQGWRPPRDMLARLARRNRWIREQLAHEPPAADDPGLVVFILREEAMRRGGLEKMVPLLEHAGFSILTTKVLAGNEAPRVASHTRGGNWGRGPWGRSGGPPAAVLVAYDPNPRPLSWRQRRKFPLANNARVLDKAQIRDAFNDGYPVDEHCNVLHSSDNGREAWDYITIAMPESAPDIRRLLAAHTAATQDGYMVVQDMTRYGARAKVERIEYQGRSAVRKTFKPGCERFCRREEWAMRELSRVVRHIPPLLASDVNSVTCPYYDDALRYKRSSGKLMPLDVALRAMAALHDVYDAGYALIDATIDNMVVDRREGLKLIDFEFLYSYETRPDSFEKSYDIAGCPQDFAADQPRGGGNSYRQHWQPYTGLSLASLLNDPRWLQHVKRTVYVLAHAHRYFPRRIRHVFRLSVHYLGHVPGRLHFLDAVVKLSPLAGEGGVRGPRRTTPPSAANPAVSHAQRPAERQAA